MKIKHRVSTFSGPGPRPHTRFRLKTYVYTFTMKAVTDNTTKIKKKKKRSSEWQFLKTLFSCGSKIIRMNLSTNLFSFLHPVWPSDHYIKTTFLIPETDLRLKTRTLVRIRFNWISVDGASMGGRDTRLLTRDSLCLAWPIQ